MAGPQRCCFSRWRCGHWRGFQPLLDAGAEASFACEFAQYPCVRIGGAVCRSGCDQCGGFDWIEESGGSDHQLATSASLGGEVTG